MPDKSVGLSRDELREMIRQLYLEMKTELEQEAGQLTRTEQLFPLFYAMLLKQTEAIIEMIAKNNEKIAQDLDQ